MSHENGVVSVERDFEFKVETPVKTDMHGNYLNAMFEANVHPDVIENVLERVMTIEKNERIERYTRKVNAQTGHNLNFFKSEVRKRTRKTR